MAKDSTTTIMISRTVKKKLDKLKVHPNQSYEEVIQTLIERRPKE